jgi:hypothetical protein
VLHPHLLHAVLLVHATEDFKAQDVQAVLNQTAAFAKVDLFDAQFDTPNVTTLRGYEAALVFSNAEWGNATALGDNMAKYFEAGGNVVLAVFATTTGVGSPEFSLLGRWKSEGYDLITPAAQISPKEDKDLIFVEPRSRLLNGVANLTATQAFQSTGAVSSPDVVVAKWGSGAPLIVRGERKGRKIVALNFYPPSSRARSDFWDITTSGAAIMRNALLYKADY